MPLFIPEIYHLLNEFEILVVIALPKFDQSFARNAKKFCEIL